MKYKTTTKALKEGCNHLKYCGYCDLQFLLYYKSANAYTSGVNGWNYDIYDLYGITICTGYRGMPGEPLEYVKEYNDKAEVVLYGNELHKNQREEVEKLIREFCYKNGGVAYEEGSEGMLCDRQDTKASCEKDR